VSPTLLALLVLGAASPALAGHAEPPAVRGPRSTRVPLYKPWPGADKVYVEVDLGDGVPRLMLLDSGAGLTFIVPAVAEELGLTLSEEVQQYLQVSGPLEAHGAVVPKLRVGRETLRDVQVAVPSGAVLDEAGGVPVAGYLGSNVLSHFQVVVDYPANRLELNRAGTQPVPPGAAPLYFDGQHAMTGIVLVASRDGQTAEQQILVDIDTGARGLWLSGTLAPELAALATRGLEPVVGVSRDDDLPLRSWLQETARIPVTQVHAGGGVVERSLDAIWTASGVDGPDALGATPGLLGHAVLDGYRAVLDYPAQRFALLPAEHTRPENDVQSWRLAQLRHSPDPLRRVRMAELYTWMGDLDRARKSLEQHHRRSPGEPEGTVMLARLRRIDGDPAAAEALLADVSPADLVKQGEIIARVDALWLDGKAPAGLELAQAAVDSAADAPAAWVALADARRAVGDLRGAREALVKANAVAQDPNGSLLRRAWIATEEGDDFGALTHLRRLLELDPSGAYTPWFYGQVAQRTGQQAMLLADLDRVRAQLHPGEGSLDFLAAGYHRAGQDDTAQELARQGMARDCESLEEAATKANCEAWYRGVVGMDLDEAARLAQAALADHAHSSEYLDTLSVVLEARGDLAGARDASWEAATQSPDDVYLLWQAARLDDALRAAGAGAGAGAASPAASPASSTVSSSPPSGGPS